jgi:hypothetical protein
MSPQLPAQLAQRIAPLLAPEGESPPVAFGEGHREKPSTNGVNECTKPCPHSFIRSLFVDGSPQ